MTVLETKQLTLREMDLNDAQRILEILTDPRPNELRSSHPHESFLLSGEGSIVLSAVLAS